MDTSSSEASPSSSDAPLPRSHTSSSSPDASPSSHDAPPSSPDAAQSGPEQTLSQDKVPSETRPPEPGIKLQYKEVNEVWDDKTSKYKVVELEDELKCLNRKHQYIFVVRRRVDHRTKDMTSYIDIESLYLQELLKEILQDVRGTTLTDNALTLELILLYNILPQLTECRPQANSIFEVPVFSEHRQILVEYIQKTFKSMDIELDSLLKKKEITFKLLQPLFKPNSKIYTECKGTGVSRCFILNYVEERRDANKSKYFFIEGRYIDYDGKSFGEATIIIEIDYFRGTKSIDHLKAYPLEYHPEEVEVTKELISRGHTFCSLRGVHHREYDGKAFKILENGDISTRHVKSRIMVDIVGFQEWNPNYVAPRVRTQKPKSEMITKVFPSGQDNTSSRLKSAYLDPDHLDESQLLVCSPTVLGFSIEDKSFQELAVAYISDIKWNTSAFKLLRIDEDQKTLVRAMGASLLSQDPKSTFGDVVSGKGLGRVILLHGPPGVGKTLTAEALAEELKMPIYVLSIGTIGIDVSNAEQIFTATFKLTGRWKAICLLDEADVFLERRELNSIHRNALVSVLLRKLEYSEGIVFLTSNRVKEFDPAVESRVNLAIRYKDLNETCRRGIWENSLKMAVTKQGPAQIDSDNLGELTKHKFNGRVIKNIIVTSQALATSEGTPVGMAHIEKALIAYESFREDMVGSGALENMRAYL